MRDVPTDFPLKPKQRRVVDATKSGMVYRSPELVKTLPLLAPPLSYLDFETFSPAIPVYENTRPYQRIPFQRSWHYDYGSGILVHKDFLANGDTDPRREVSETLLRVSEQFSGAVMAWSNYETSVIRDMADLFADLAERLVALQDCRSAPDCTRPCRTPGVLRLLFDEECRPCGCSGGDLRRSRYRRWRRGISSFLPHPGRPRAVTCGS